MMEWKVITHQAKGGCSSAQVTPCSPSRAQVASSARVKSVDGKLYNYYSNGCSSESVHVKMQIFV